jgi:hypothetical protein
MNNHDQIIFPVQMPIPEEAFKFLDYLREMTESQLGLNDIESLKMTKHGTDTSDKISDQIRKRMGRYGNGR